MDKSNYFKAKRVFYNYFKEYFESQNQINNYKDKMESLCGCVFFMEPPETGKEEDEYYYYQSKEESANRRSEIALEKIRNKYPEYFKDGVLIVKSLEEIGLVLLMDKEFVSNLLVARIDDEDAGYLVSAIMKSRKGKASLLEIIECISHQNIIKATIVKKDFIMLESKIVSDYYFSGVTSSGYIDELKDMVLRNDFLNELYNKSLISNDFIVKSK